MLIQQVPQEGKMSHIQLSVISREAQVKDAAWLHRNESKGQASNKKETKQSVLNSIKRSYVVVQSRSSQSKQRSHRKLKKHQNN